VEGKPQLIVPYTLDANDMRFAAVQGFNSGDQFYAYLKDSFDTLYAEGSETPRLMSIGLHCRLVGRQGRIASLERSFNFNMRKAMKPCGSAGAWILRVIGMSDIPSGRRDDEADACL
jgi:hypothetical protein